MNPFWSPLWPDQLHAVVPLDEARETGLHVASAAALAVHRLYLRCEHLVE